MTREEHILEKMWKDADNRFRSVFKYTPNFPPEVDFDVEAYVKVIDKCIEDKFDYTIELYGTVPVKNIPWSGVYID